jgi:hypothetical protein
LHPRVMNLHVRKSFVFFWRLCRCFPLWGPCLKLQGSRAWCDGSFSASLSTSKQGDLMQVGSSSRRRDRPGCFYRVFLCCWTPC